MQFSPPANQGPASPQAMTVPVPLTPSFIV